MLYQILCRLLHHSKEHQTDPPNFWIEKILDLRNCMVHVMLFSACSINQELVPIRPQLKLLWMKMKKSCGKLVYWINYTYWASVSSLLLCWKGLLPKRGRGAKGPKTITILSSLWSWKVCVHRKWLKNKNGGFYQLCIDNKSVPIF